MIEAIQFTLNEKSVSIEVDGERMLLWVLRTDLGLTGANYGCGEALCGVCTVLLDSEAVFSCQTPHSIRQWNLRQRSREEEVCCDTFRPAVVVKIRSGIDGAGRMVLWDCEVYFAGRRGCENFCAIPHHRENVYGEWRIAPGIHPFAVGPWRAPAANTNMYARDLHINLMASRAGEDPLEYRLSHLKDKRMLRVLEAAAQRFGWTSAKTPGGRGQGISCGIDAETYVACMAEVEVEKDSGKIRVKRVVCAQHMGQVVNPQGAVTQMEGCITMGLGYALTEEISFRDNRVLDANFDSCEIPRFSRVPEIETVLVENPELPPKGGGEPAIICMGGVLATAVFAATGAKLLGLPMTPERVKRALKDAQ